MSDHNHSDHSHSHQGHGEHDKLTHGAGHEMDVPPTKELFNIIWGLGALTLLSLATCVQLFNNQQHDITAERGKESSAVLMQYRQGMDAVTKSAGEVAFSLKLGCSRLKGASSCGSASRLPAWPSTASTWNSWWTAARRNWWPRAGRPRTPTRPRAPSWPT